MLMKITEVELHEATNL